MLVLQTLSLAVRTEEVHAACAPEGDGSRDCPYVVTDAAGLSAIRHDLSAHYRLGADIDLAGYDYDEAGPDTGGWMPIGDAAAPFTGTLDGNGYAIRSLTIDRPSMSFAGLFGQIGTESSPLDETGLWNVRLLDVRISGRETVGSLAGNVVKATIADSYATGRVAASGTGAGGLVGTTQGLIVNSYAVVQVSGQTRVGGLAGTNAGTVRNSYAAGSVSANDDEAGGLAGYASPSSIIKDSYSLGNVKGVPGFTGGLIGRGDGSSSAPGSYWNKETSGQSGSEGGTGKTTEEMKASDPFADWDAAVWGFRPGELYPYLRAFGMGITLEPLAAATYSLHPGQDALSVTGSLFHETDGEPLAIKYDIRNGSDATVVSAVYGAVADSGGLLPIDRRFSLTGFANGSYTISVTAQDTRNTEVGAMLAFKVDTASPPPPSIGFAADGSEAWASSASTAVTVSDSGGGVDAATLQYAWSTDTVTPFSGWSPFANGQTLSQSGVDGEWYLHVRAKDAAGHPANAVSGRFRLNTSSAVLDGLTLSAGELAPVFAPGTFDYTARVASGVSGIAVTPDAAHAADTIAVSVNGGAGQTVADGATSGRLALRTGTNAIDVVVTALNGTQNTYKVAVYRPSSGGGSGSPGPGAAETGETGRKPDIALDSDGGVLLKADSSMIDKVERPDGAFAEVVRLDSETLNEALALLRQAPKPKLTVAVNDSERDVRLSLPAEWIARADAAVPQAVVNMRLSGSAFGFELGALDLQGLAARLGAEPGDWTVNVEMERASETVGEELARAASVYGGRLIGAAVEYRLAAVTAGGRREAIGDVGGSYPVRALVPGNRLAGAWTAVRYDREAQTVAFAPAVQRLRADGKPEVVISAPLDGIYAVLETGGAAFADLDGHWAQADIGLLSAKLIVRGVAERRYAPDAEVTRAEFAALLVRALALPTGLVGGDAGFADVAADAWYASAVRAAADAGLVGGTAAGRFAPDERITREQMAVMLVRALSLAGRQGDSANSDGAASRGLSAFPDRDAVAPWAAAAAARAANAGLVTGMPDGAFAPRERVTRAQAAVLLARLLRYVGFVE
ncbi:S-layer homology domain-containing protein [Cohnella cellulosilytica]